MGRKARVHKMHGSNSHAKSSGDAGLIERAICLATNLSPDLQRQSPIKQLVALLSADLGQAFGCICSPG
jgi:hypothetical protein